MADQEDYNQLYHEIGRKLWSMMPNDAQELHFVAVIHDDVDPGWEPGGVLDWKKVDGSKGHYTSPAQRPPYSLERETISLLRRLRSLDLFERERWTHVLVSLSNAGKLKIDFAYVPREDDWANLYMRGVSDLTLEEAVKNHIPVEDWAGKVRFAIARHERAAADAEATGRLEEVEHRQALVRTLRERLAHHEANPDLS